MTEREYRLVCNLTRVRAVLEVLKEVEIDDPKAQEKLSNAFLDLFGVEKMLARQVKVG